MAARLVQRLPATVQSPHFWLLVAMFVFGALLHYSDLIGLPEFGPSRHTMERVLFLLPITYGGFIYGLRGGLISLGVAALIMLPRAIFMSPAPVDALTETILVLVTGGLIDTWFHGYEREKERYEREKEHRRQALEQLLQSEERYRDLFENASDAIWLHDLEGNIFAANRACERVSGYSSEELKGINVGQLVAEDSKPGIEEIEQGLLENRPVDHRCEVELVKKGGEKAIVQMTTSLITQEGQSVGFQHAARDVTEERQMQENLRYYLQQLTRTQEEERKRIARELHDDTIQNLIVISRRLDKLASGEGMPAEESAKIVADVKQQMQAALQSLRHFSHDLRPSVLDDLGLLPALELLAGDLERQRVATNFEVTGEARRLLPEVEVMLFRIAQEAVRNIWRHAQASAAELTVEFSDTKVRVSISDNGMGFKLPQRPGDLASSGKLGLAGMHERVRLVSGTLTLKSAPGKGTTVVAEVPL